MSIISTNKGIEFLKKHTIYDVGIVVRVAVNTVRMDMIKIPIVSNKCDKN
ncbi:hypothetical protein DFQ07_0472 [Tenacibaculum caenipelagi]|uniref:Uncharacterized protein n=1 Tax=Tenacibaculum caenipelagi TaxID=1325435 RepID=A0A4R6TI08_9FLAO|nr:hypothetical protein DFQ07_0472 [Tenacibaculum caenipelagi]